MDLVIHITKIFGHRFVEPRQMNAIVSAADQILAEFRREPIQASPDGLAGLASRVSKMRFAVNGGASLPIWGKVEKDADARGYPDVGREHPKLYARAFATSPKAFAW